MDDISLEEALAWVYARDLKFVEFVEKRAYRPLEEAFKAFSESRPQQFKPVCTGHAEAWRLLKSAIVAKKIQLSGVRFIPTNEVARKSTGAPPRPIKRFPVESFFLEEQRWGATLYFAGTRALEARWWRHVQFDRGAVFEAFQSEPLKPVRIKNEATRLKKSSAPYVKIEQAVSAIWPDGRVTEKRTARNERIRAWWTKQGDGHRVGLSDTTIDAFFRMRRGEK